MKRRDLLAWLPAAGLPGLAWAQPAKDDIVLGQTADFSASRAAISKAYAEGAALHFTEVNASGGVNGRRIRVVQLDDAYDVVKAEVNARELVEKHGAFALVHLVGTAIVGKVLPYATESQTPLIHPLTGADQVRPPLRRVKEAFFLRASYGREIERMVTQFKTLGIRRIGLLHEDEPFGHGIRDAVNATMAAQQLSLSATGVIPPNQIGTDAVLGAVAALKKASPDAILVGSAGPVVERFIRAYHEAGGRTQYYGLSVTNVDRLHSALGPLSHGIVVAQVMPDVRTSNLPVVRDYLQAAAKRDSAATTFGLEGYLSARMISQALRDAGAPLTRDRFIPALERQTQVGGFPVRYQEPRQGSPFVELAMIGRDGKLVQ